MSTIHGHTWNTSTSPCWITFKQVVTIRYQDDSDDDTGDDDADDYDKNE